MEAELVSDEQLKSVALTALEQATQIKITDGQSYTAAGEFWNYCKAKAKFAREKIKPRVDELHRAHKNMVAFMSECVDPWENAAEFIKKQRMIPYDQEQERIRQREQARLAAEARAKEEAERAELAALLKEAGETDAAQEVAEQPVETPQVILPKSTPKVETFSYRSNWTFQIECGDCDQWVRARDAETQHKGHHFIIIEMDDEYKLPNLTKIGAVVRAMKKATNIPGIKVIEEKV